MHAWQLARLPNFEFSVASIATSITNNYYRYCYCYCYCFCAKHSSGPSCLLVCLPASTSTSTSASSSPSSTLLFPALLFYYCTVLYGTVDSVTVTVVTTLHLLRSFDPLRWPTPRPCVLAHSHCSNSLFFYPKPKTLPYLTLPFLLVTYLPDLPACLLP
jgi:hypothetical protein